MAAKGRQSIIFFIILITLISTMEAFGASGSPPQKDGTSWGEICQQKFSPTNQNQVRATVKGNIATEEVDVAIVGGGLVGLALAIGLTRAGINCAVYERAPQLRSVSQGILAVKPIGMQALEDIHPDIPNRVVENGSDIVRTMRTNVDDEGTTKNVLNENMGVETEVKYGRKIVLITWHNMQQVLASLLPPGMVKTGRSLSSFEEGEDSVTLHFEGGEATVRCNVALMCDGVFSTARTQLFPEDKVVYFGQLNWGSVVRTDSLPSAIHPPNAVRYCQYSGEPKWMAMLNDGGGGYTFFQLRISDPEKALALSGNGGRGGLGLSGAIERLSPIVKPCKDVESVLTSIPEEQIFERSIVGRRPTQTWLSPRKRVALVGDAAHGMHPNIGQGANTGFESARNLIRALTECDGDLKSGLMAYERGHKPRADLIQSFANLMGCVQLQQKELLPKGVVSQMMEWANTDDDANLPSEDALDIIRKFDPLSQQGVSLII